MKDFDMKEWMILGALVTGAALAMVAAAGVAATGCSSCVDQRATAEPQARAWATGLGLTVANVSCTDRDTDGDGYVSCTVATKNDKGDVQLHAVECAGRLTWNDGCRVPKLRAAGSGGE